MMTGAMRSAAPAAVAVSRIRGDDWDELVVAGQGPLRHGFVNAWRQVELPNLESEALAVWGGGRLSAAVHAYSYDLDMVAGADTRFVRPVELLRRVMPRAGVARVLELGSPTPIVNPFLACGEPTEQAISAIVRAAKAMARAAGAEMMIVQNFEQGAQRETIARALRLHGFAPIPIEPTVVLQLPFDSFDEYVGAMRTQYRRRLRKVFDRSSHLEAEVIEDFGDLAFELAQLWRLVWNRAEELKREILTPAFFHAAAELEYVHVLALRRPDGSIASYALLLEDAPWLHFLYTGFEREAGEREGAYFRLIYEIARYAIERGFASVNLGMTTIEPKLDAGGVVVPLTAWIHHRRPWLHRVEVALARALYAPTVAARRHVFKGQP